jgi:hypothetical protein
VNNIENIENRSRTGQLSDPATVRTACYIVLTTVVYIDDNTMTAERAGHVCHRPVSVMAIIVLGVSGEKAIPVSN